MQFWLSCYFRPGLHHCTAWRFYPSHGYILPYSGPLNLIEYAVYWLYTLLAMAAQQLCCQLLAAWTVLHAEGRGSERSARLQPGIQPSQLSESVPH